MRRKLMRTHLITPNSQKFRFRFHFWPAGYEVMYVDLNPLYRYALKCRSQPEYDFHLASRTKRVYNFQCSWPMHYVSDYSRRNPDLSTVIVKFCPKYKIGFQLQLERCSKSAPTANTGSADWLIIFWEGSITYFTHRQWFFLNVSSRANGQYLPVASVQEAQNLSQIWSLRPLRLDSISRAWNNRWVSCGM